MDNRQRVSERHALAIAVVGAIAILLTWLTARGPSEAMADDAAPKPLYDKHAPIDPIAFGGTALLFLVVLALAAWTPANRAAATDPATALRAE